MRRTCLCFRSGPNPREFPHWMCRQIPRNAPPKPSLCRVSVLVRLRHYPVAVPQWKRADGILVVISSIALLLSISSMYSPVRWCCFPFYSSHCLLFSSWQRVEHSHSNWLLLILFECFVIPPVKFILSHYSMSALHCLRIHHCLPGVW